MYAEIKNGATGTITLDNQKNITVDQEEAVGIYINNQTGDRTKAIAKNSAPDGTINLNAAKNVGIMADNGTGINDSVINVKNGNSAGMYGNRGALITNNKAINVSHENSAGMYTSDSDAENYGTGVITLTSAASATEGSAGMYGKLTVSATKDYKTSNAGTINLTSTTKNVGIYEKFKAGASNKLTLENKKEINITAGRHTTEGIFANNAADVDNLLVHNTSDGVITADSSSSIGISAQKSRVVNDGNITMNGTGSAGIYGKQDSIVTNNKEIVVKNNTSAGIFLEDSNATNSTDGTIKVSNNTSAGIYGKFTTGSHTIVNDGTITLDNVNSATKSAGIYGNLTGGKLDIENNKKIDVNMGESVGIYALNGTSSVNDLTATNNDTITLNNIKTVGIFANKSKAVNNKNIDLGAAATESTGIFGNTGANVENASAGVITVAGTAGTATKSSGIYVDGNGTSGVNSGKVLLNGENSNGMVATTGAAATNKKEITGSVANVIGMYGAGAGTSIVNDSTDGTITLQGIKSTGMFSKDGTVSENKGKIVLTGTSGGLDSSNNKVGSVGMFGISSGIGNTINMTNSGTIDVESSNSTGMFASNAGNLTDSTINNRGTVNLKNSGTVGIYTPKSDIQTVGTINLSEAADSSVAVYLKDGAKAKSVTGIINLGKFSQNRVAYYIKGTGAADTGKLYDSNIGTVTGYGVGVYLDGGVLDSNTPVLDYTSSSDGNGLIGLLMKGASADISSYTGGIKVGNSVLGAKNYYAIGIYADGQGTAGTSGVAKGIAANITTGANGVGLFAENGSNITYSGTMNIGDETTAGTGIYVGNSGSNASKVTIAPTAYITLNGTNGVGAVVDVYAALGFISGATIEFKGDGVGIYGKKGADITDGGGTLITNGHSVERVM